MKRTFFKIRKKAINIKKKEHLKLVFKSLFYNEKLSKNIRIKILFDFQKLQNRKYVTELKNICWNSYKTRDISRFIKLNNLLIKEELYKGNLNGFRKSS